MKKILMFVILLIATFIATSVTAFAAHPAGTENWNEVNSVRLLRGTDVKISDIPADIYEDALASAPSGYTITDIRVDARKKGYMFFLFEYKSENPSEPIAAKIYEVNTGHSLFSRDVQKEYGHISHLNDKLAFKYPSDFLITVNDPKVGEVQRYKELPNPIPYGAANQTTTPAASPIAATQAQTNDINILVNGTAVNFTGQGPIVQNGTTLVPVRGVFEQLGFTVAWDNSTRTVMLTNGKDTIVIPVGQANFTANGKTITPAVPAQTINGSTMLPLRAICESIGSEVNWDNATKTATISYSK